MTVLICIHNPTRRYTVEFLNPFVFSILKTSNPKWQYIHQHMKGSVRIIHVRIRRDCHHNNMEHTNCTNQHLHNI